MSSIILDTKCIIKSLNANKWELLYNDIYIFRNDKFCIRAILIQKDIWYEVDRPFFMKNCYEYSSTNLKDCVEYCNKNFGANILYF